MHNHDEMVILCTEIILGISHKLNGTPKINIAFNGLKLHKFFPFTCCSPLYFVWIVSPAFSFLCYYLFIYLFCRGMEQGSSCRRALRQKNVNFQSSPARRYDLSILTHASHDEWWNLGVLFDQYLMPYLFSWPCISYDCFFFQLASSKCSFIKTGYLRIQCKLFQQFIFFPLDFALLFTSCFVILPFLCIHVNRYFKTSKMLSVQRE